MRYGAAPNITIRLCACTCARYSIGHTFSMLTGSGHCVVLRLHAFSRSRDRSLKPRSTTMLVSTRAFNSEWAKNTWGWRVVSIPKEDARCTDIAACKPVFASMTTMRWSHSALRLDQGMLLYVLWFAERRARWIFRTFHSTFASRKCFCLRNFNN